jgi:hypothetical protein
VPESIEGGPAARHLGLNSAFWCPSTGAGCEKNLGEATVSSLLPFDSHRPEFGLLLADFCSALALLCPALSEHALALTLDLSLCRCPVLHFFERSGLLDVLRCAPHSRLCKVSTEPGRRRATARERRGEGERGVHVLTPSLHCRRLVPLRLSARSSTFEVNGLDCSLFARVFGHDRRAASIPFRHTLSKGNVGVPILTAVLLPASVVDRTTYFALEPNQRQLKVALTLEGESPFHYRSGLFCVASVERSNPSFRF